MHLKHQHVFSNQICLAPKLIHHMFMKIQIKGHSEDLTQDPSLGLDDSKL